jgi:hypothetical protein
MIMMGWKEEELEPQKEYQCKHQSVVSFEKSNHRKNAKSNPIKIIHLIDNQKIP